MLNTLSVIFLVMSSFLEHVFASLPQMERGVAKVIGGDPKGNNFLYTNGKCVVIRNIDVIFLFLTAIFKCCLFNFDFIYSNLGLVLVIIHIGHDDILLPHYSKLLVLNFKKYLHKSVKDSICSTCCCFYVS